MLGIMTVTLKLLVDFCRHSYWMFYPSFKSVKIPLPQVIHKVISKEEVEGKKILFIGDIHGCLDEVKELLEKCNYFNDSSNTILVSVGDVINKGPKSAETLRFVQNLKIHMVRGNHENNCLRRLVAFREYNIPIAVKAEWIKELTTADEEFLRELPYTLSIPSVNAMVVHAGLVPGIPLEYQKPNHMVSMRNVNPDTLAPTAKIEIGDCWAKHWVGPEVVVFGHDARRGVQRFPYAFGIDGGCVYGNKLIGMLIDPNDGDKMWERSKLLSVKAKDQYVVVEGNLDE